MRSDQDAKIRSAVVEIVQLERSQCPDWGRVSKLSSRALRRIVETALEPDPEDYIIKFLDDWRIRMAEPKYGEYQRNKILDILIS